MRIPQDPPRVKPTGTRLVEQEPVQDAPVEQEVEESQPESPADTPEQIKSRDAARNEAARAMYQWRTEDRRLADAGGPQTDVGPVALGGADEPLPYGKSRTNKMVESYLSRMPRDMRNDVKASLSKLGIATPDISDAIHYVRGLKADQISKMAGVGSQRSARELDYTNLSGNLGLALERGDQQALNRLINENGGLAGFVLQAQEMARREEEVLKWEGDDSRSELHQKVMSTREDMQKQIRAYGPGKAGPMLASAMMIPPFGFGPERPRKGAADGPDAPDADSKRGDKVNPVDDTNTKGKMGDPGPEGGQRKKRTGKTTVEVEVEPDVPQKQKAGRGKSVQNPDVMNARAAQQNSLWQIERQKLMNSDSKAASAAGELAETFVEEGKLTKETIEETIEKAGLTTTEVLETGLKRTGVVGKISKLKALGDIDDAATLAVLMTGLLYATYDRGHPSEPFSQGNVY